MAAVRSPLEYCGGDSSPFEGLGASFRVLSSTSSTWAVCALPLHGLPLRALSLPLFFFGQVCERCPVCLQLKHFPAFISEVCSLFVIWVLMASMSMVLGSLLFCCRGCELCTDWKRLSHETSHPFGFVPIAAPIRVWILTSSLAMVCHSSRVRGMGRRCNRVLWSQTFRPEQK